MFCLREHRRDKMAQKTPQSIGDLFEFTVVVYKHFPLIL